MHIGKRSHKNPKGPGIGCIKSAALDKNESRMFIALEGGEFISVDSSKADLRQQLADIGLA